MLPFTLLARTSRPPFPILPDAWRGPQRPVIVSGKSLSIPPETVSKRKLASKRAGTYIATDPLTVLKFMSSSPWREAILASTFPLTVSAVTGPAAVFTVTPPFTVLARTSDPTSRTETPPFTECAPTLTERGTLTVILTSEWFSLLPLWRNDSTPPSSQRALLFQIAQIVTLPSAWTTSKWISSISRPFDRFSATR